MIFLKIGLAIAAFFLLAVFLTSLICYLRMFYSKPRRVLGEEEFEIPEGEIYEVFREDMVAWTRMIRAYPFEELSITSRDGLTLRAKFFEHKKGAPIELMFHGYKGNAERDLNGGVERCFSLGHSALLIDHRGSGFSDGNTIGFGILEKQDCLDWVSFAVAHFGEDARLILTGISMGAATVMMAAGTPLPPQVRYVLADCGFTSSRDIISKVMVDMKLPPRLLYPFVRLGARIFGGFDPDADSPMEAMERCTLPIVFAHGEADGFVPCDMSRRLYAACRSEHKRLITIPKADHGLAFPVAREDYVEALAAFKRDCGFDF